MDIVPLKSIHRTRQFCLKKNARRNQFNLMGQIMNITVKYVTLMSYQDLSIVDNVIDALLASIIIVDILTIASVNKIMITFSN
jgi:hypothetical protein